VVPPISMGLTCSQIRVSYWQTLVRLVTAPAIEPPLWTLVQFLRFRAHPDDPRTQASHWSKRDECPLPGKLPEEGYLRADLLLSCRACTSPERAELTRRQKDQIKNEITVVSDSLMAKSEILSARRQENY
jgi:hypothetical protein